MFGDLDNAHLLYRSFYKELTVGRHNKLSSELNYHTSDMNVTLCLVQDIM